MDRYRIKPGNKVDLSKFDPEETSAWDGDKDAAKQRLAELLLDLDALQEVLYAEHKQKLLVIFQALDTGGKDGVIHSVFGGLNPQGVKVASFKVPTPVEADHDFLWRVHNQVPGKGEITVFNRSHYEEVLVVRVHNLQPEERWRKHYRQIADFERMLVEEGTTILKFYLHISPDEQATRLVERIETPEKRWKFNPADLDERKLWDDYIKAFEEALTETSTEQAPWYVVPANRNWYRNLVVATVIRDTLKGLKMKYPDPVENIEQYLSSLK